MLARTLSAKPNGADSCYSRWVGPGKKGPVELIDEIVGLKDGRFINRFAGLDWAPLVDGHRVQ